MSDSTPMSIQTQIEKWLKRLEELYGDRPDRVRAFAKEKQLLPAYIRALIGHLDDQGLYRLVDPLAVGGTGVIFKGNQVNLPNRDVVVKFSRPLDPDDEMSIVENSMLENERKVLPQFTHANIIQVLDVGSLDIAGEPVRKMSYIIEPFIDSEPLGYRDENEEYSGYIINLTRSRCLLRKKIDPLVLNQILQKLVSLLRQWVSAIEYVHDKGYLYLDVKPENVIISKDGYHLSAIDFGSAQELDPNDENSLKAYFTARYADPDLRRNAESLTSRNRVRRAIKRKDLKFEFDYYALGKSILEILTEIAKIRVHDFPQLPLFRSLHFLATRLLNGKNEEPTIVEEEYSGQETFGELRQADYQMIRYKSRKESALSDVLRDLGKEDGSWNPEMLVPELATYSKDSIRVVQGFNTAVTPRLLALMEHPIFARLKLVTQLGLISLVYPTADHSRFDHILGTYTYTTSYVKSLFNDSQNPLFRNLVDEKDIRTVLLAALVHDMGQYPLAHDLEEVQPRVFDHVPLSVELIERDKTLKDLITRDDDPSCWGVNIESLRKILRAQSPQSDLAWFAETGIDDFKADMLSALIDGPIDADKADYVIRDSEECRIPYGQQLDVERLLRTLTCAIYLDSTDPRGSHRVTIGVYEKGRASAESLNLARYELFASVYWHHTSRELKAMLQYATALALPVELLGQTGSDERIRGLREQLLDFVVKLAPPFDIEPEGKARQRQTPRKRGVSYTEDTTLDVMQDSRLQTVPQTSNKWYPGIAYTDWQMLRWIQKLPNASKESIALIEGILRRELYKRVYLLAPSKEEEKENLRKTVADLRWPERIRLAKNMHAIVSDILRKQRPDTGQDRFEEVDQILANNLAMLVDIPNPEKKIGFTRPLVYVPELKEKTYYQTGEEPVTASQMNDSVKLLMTSISPIRIICHPDLRQFIRRYISPKQIPKIIERALAQMK